MSTRCSGGLFCTDCDNHHLNPNDINCQENSRSELSIGNRLAPFHRSIHVLVFDSCAVYVLSSVGESDGEARTIAGKLELSSLFTLTSYLSRNVFSRDMRIISNA